MSDTEGTSPASETPREGSTGRYVSGRADGKAGDEATTSPTPAAGDPDAGKEDEKEGRKRWLLLLLLLLILLLLLCAGFVYMKWFKKDTGTTPTPSPTTAVATTGAPQPSPTPTVTVSPSASPTVKTVAMPDVVGKPAPEAKTILEAAGFTNIKFVDEANGNTLNLIVSYVVTKQSVAAGTQVPVDTALVITAKTSSSGKG